VALNAPVIVNEESEIIRNNNGCKLASAFFVCDVKNCMQTCKTFEALVQRNFVLLHEPSLANEINININGELK
jgi:hypothetical protein